MASLNFEDEKIQFRLWFDEQRPLFSRSLSVMRSLLSELLADGKVFSPPVVTGRVKDRDECLGKFSRKYQTNLEEAGTPYEIKDHLTDIVGLRVVCLYETDVSEIRNLLQEHFEFLGIRIKRWTEWDDSDRFEPVDSGLLGGHRVLLKVFVFHD